MADSTGARSADLTIERVERLKRLDDLTADLSLEEAERAIRLGRLTLNGRPVDGEEADGAELNLVGVRQRIRSTITDLAETDLAGATVVRLRELVEAYVRLGGDLELAPEPPAPRINPADVKVREAVRAAAWRAANDAGAEAATADRIAAKVAETLEELAR